MRMSAALVSAVALAAASNAQAQTPSPAEPAAKPKEGKVVCKTVYPTDSRLGSRGRRICSTEGAWDDLSAEGRASARATMNSNRFTPAPTASHTSIKGGGVPR